MLEPQAENPKVLLEHHRRQAALNREAGDKKAAEWHGIRAQRAYRALEAFEREPQGNPVGFRRVKESEPTLAELAFSLPRRSQPGCLAEDA